MCKITFFPATGPLICPKLNTQCPNLSQNSSKVGLRTSNHLQLGRSFNQNVSMSLDSLAVETAKPHTNRLYRAVSRYHEKGDLPICTASRLSVSSMDLSQPSVAARKEFWEERAKSREPSHPCRNCQVAQDIAEQLTRLSLVYNNFLQFSTIFYNFLQFPTSFYKFL